MEQSFKYQAEVESITDGDTAHLNINLGTLPRLRDLLKYPVATDYIDLGFSFYVPTTWAMEMAGLMSRPCWIRDERIRFYGINAPERNTIAGLAAQDYVRSLLPPRTIVEIATFRVKGRTKQEKFGRYLATIYKDGENINQKIVTAGHAKPFMV